MLVKLANRRHRYRRNGSHRRYGCQRQPEPPSNRSNGKATGVGLTGVVPFDPAVAPTYPVGQVVTYPTGQLMTYERGNSLVNKVGECQHQRISVNSTANGHTGYVTRLYVIGVLQEQPG
ncbi:hypothetical protein ACEQPO_05670 [Bacillus sp. SL00103]